LQPKHGFRYGPSAFVPATAPINAPPPPLGLQGSAAAPPPVMGTQQGPAYSNDPFGGNDFQQQPNYEPAAQSLGYTKGTQNPLGILQAVPVLGTAMGAMGAFDNMPNQTYGKPGTYDAQGNVFGEKGRAYNPVTGAPAQSYASTGDWMGGWLGIGTPEGAFGSSSSYGKLRAAGEDIPNSLFGSYENSTYNIPRADRMFGVSPASQQGMGTIAGNIAANTQLRTGRDMGLEFDPSFGSTGKDITPEMLGFNKSSMRYNAAKNNTGVFGTGVGDIFTTPGSYQQGVINEKGQVVTPDGTMVSITDLNGKKHSLLGNTQQNLAVLEMISRQGQFAQAGVPPSGAGCFLAGTKVTMANNTTKNIEDIESGDKVISFDEDNNLVEDEVIKIHIHEAGTMRPSDKMIKATLTNGDIIIATSNHPFYMPEHNGFKWLGLFEKGELVMQQDGLCYAVSDIENLGEITETVYNFEVKDTHTYIADGIRVHNGGGEDSGGSDEDVDQDLQQDIAMASHMASNPSSNADSNYSYSSSFDPSDSDTQALVGATSDIVSAAGNAKAAGTDMQAAVTAAEAKAAADADVQQAFTNATNITDYASTIK
jgi:hypothetical protein